jgi:hypothetical protein
MYVLKIGINSIIVRRLSMVSDFGVSYCDTLPLGNNLVNVISVSVNCNTFMILVRSGDQETSTKGSVLTFIPQMLLNAGKSC